MPPNQSIEMHRALKSKRIKTKIVMFKGEQHGWRKAENIEKSFSEEYQFFSEVFRFETFQV